jgi:hypothetical protein
MNSKLLSATLVTFLALAGCSGGGTAEPSQSGGNSGTGGSTSPGGAGGSIGSGGTASSGGVSGTGGNSVSGGTTSSGGNGSGGVTGTGGKPGTGGSGNGGATATGGSTVIGTGGASVTGGTTAKGGASGTGGSPAVGGTNGTGGTTAKGGATGTGGTTGTAGATGMGGGTSVTVGASGYPAAGATGTAKPSATGTTVTVLSWAGFKSAISFTFDDANSSQISNYTALQAQNDKGNNVRYTFFLQTGKTEAGNTIWKTAHNDGHELGNHTKSHQSGATTTDIQAAEDFIKTTFGVTSYSVAAPNGDNSYVGVVGGMKEFLTNRTAGNSGGIAPTDDPAAKQFQLPCIIPGTGASASTMESSITSGTSGGKWNTFLVHGFSGGSDGAYQPVAIGEFTSTVSWAKTQGTLWIDTVENVSAYWIAQYRFTKLTPTTSGTDKVWTWKTSDFNNPYPPGKYLRVKTDGGTLKQGSTVLNWDDHGYYEISLDAGTLTLSP